MNEIDLYLSVNQKQVPLCGNCDGDDLLVCCEQLAAEPNVPLSFRGITHAYAIKAGTPAGWIVTGPLDTISDTQSGGQRIVTRALDWLERSTGQHRTRDFDSMSKLVESIDQTEVAFGVTDVTGDDLKDGLPDFDHYCCACQKTVPIRWKKIDGRY